LCLACLASSARADDLTKAKEHYRNATRAYELGAYEEAIREYSEAYRLKDDPAILYNMAQAHRLAEHHAEALRLYRMFLIKVPEAPNRAEVVTKIDALQKLVDDQKKAKTLPPDTTLPRAAPETPPPSSPPAPVAAPPPPPVAPPTPAADSHPGRTKKIAGLAVGIVGVAAVGAGIAMSVLAKQASDDLTRANQNGLPFDKNKYDTGKAQDIAGGVLIGVGGAAVVVGVVVGVLGIRESKAKRVAFLPWVNGRGAGAVLEVRR
jgi:tetratricopeptide (TPR) repeat protein